MLDTWTLLRINKDQISTNRKVPKIYLKERIVCPSLTQERTDGSDFLVLAKLLNKKKSCTTLVFCPVSWFPVTEELFIISSVLRCGVVKQPTKLVDFFSINLRGKQADVSPDSKRSAPLMDTHNTRRVTRALPAFKKGIRSFLEDLKAVTEIKNNITLELLFIAVQVFLVLHSNWSLKNKKKAVERDHLKREAIF
uniref:SFRICE_033942 n=1 Tax=Spodoptera frugiperda TaxID=7108 RepID=A0A2H1WAQ7_SPOFR